ncbi:type II toxin-antitoxin system VapC family toxin [Fibrivirga algicola]|uniref:Type II toxin-antitoxin system VapC family toxin n=1 Tax=Fibrivirga algicola TaxID=2950420 RepID=A0ABX0QTI9_9BACT|nr:type II toxin-antitoxin system VapC family toxin [Fibrivirga algicola]NID13499.1 type II toxin-antitoxin system VapC family toxin [Fibrivirga algicola]
MKFIHLIDSCPIVNLNWEVTRFYAEIDVFSQGRSKQTPLPLGISARNMGKNDLWIAAIALYLNMELHTADHDFDHLLISGLKLIKHPV